MRILVMGIACLVASGCSAFEECPTGERRCTSAGELEECTPHPAGIDVSPDPYIGHHDRSPNTWEPSAACGAGLCQQQAKTDSYGAPLQDAFCTLSATPNPACGASTFVCDGTTSIECRAGFAVTEMICATCDATVEGCKGHRNATCAATSDCAEGLVCVPIQGCQMPCTCAEGTRCEACDVADRESVVPSSTQFAFVCKSGWCERATLQ
jgi:hypothetical protein